MPDLFFFTKLNDKDIIKSVNYKINSHRIPFYHNKLKVITVTSSSVYHKEFTGGSLEDCVHTFLESITLNFIYDKRTSCSGVLLTH